MRSLPVFSVSDDDVLCKVNRIGRVARQIPVRRDGNILVGDDAVDLRVRVDDGALHEDGVLDDRTLLDDDAAEEQGVLDGAFNGAAVGDERIAGLGTLAVKGRDVVRDLGGDGVLRANT